MLTFCILRLFKKFLIDVNQAVGHPRKKKQHFFKCSLKNSCSMWSFQKKKTLRICMCMTILQHNVLTWWFFKFTWAGTGLENTHYFHKGWLHLAPGFGPFCCFCCVYILTYITFVQCFKESNQFPTSINILDCDTISSFQKCQTLEI